MKKFKNIRTGIVETVTNKKLIEQYEKHTEVYEEVKEKKVNKPVIKEEPKAE